VQARIEQLRIHYGPMITYLGVRWNSVGCDFSGSGKGMAASGTIYVNESLVVVQGTLPALAMLFKGQIELIVRRDLEAILS